MGIYGILWVLKLDVNTYYLSIIILLFRKKIDTAALKREQTKKLIGIFLFKVPDKL